MEFIILILLPFLSGGLSFFLHTKQAQIVRFLLTISGGFLFGTVMLHLFPEVFEEHSSAGIFILIGFFIQLILEKFSEGVEHGHLHLELPDGHDHGHDHTHYHKKSWVTAIGLLVSLSIHSILEGLPLAQLTYTDISDLRHNALFLAVLVHKIPTSIAFVAVLNQTGIQKKWIILLLLWYTIMTPTGAFLGSLLHTSLGTYSLSTTELTALAAGMLLHIASTILFESTEHHKFSFLKIGASLAGALLVLLV
jgi:zinc and cadmium transporter